jgi:hypothetical protein
MPGRLLNALFLFPPFLPWSRHAEVRERQQSEQDSFRVLFLVID